MHNGTTITQFIIEEQRHIEGATGDFTSLLNDIVTACKVISNLVNKGELIGVLGSAESENVQGETQKKLDILTNEVFIKSNEWAGHLSAMASEEMDEIYEIPSQYPRGKYLLTFDPLDGSSNTDVNVSVGTIFSILRCPGERVCPNLDAFLQPGYAAGRGRLRTVWPIDDDGADHRQRCKRFYAGPGHRRVHPDPSEHDDPRNRHANLRSMRPTCVSGSRRSNVMSRNAWPAKKVPRGEDFNMRWIASMVAEVHRILTRGGIFMYPIDDKMKAEGTEGKLRLMYEANPMSFIVEQAGGASSTGRQRIMDLAPRHLHQRVPVILGSREEVDRVVSYHAE